MRNYYNGPTYIDYLDFIEDFDDSEFTIIDNVEYGRILEDFNKLLNLKKSGNSTNKKFKHASKYYVNQFNEYTINSDLIGLRNDFDYTVNWETLEISKSWQRIEDYDDYIMGGFNEYYYDNFHKFKSILFLFYGF